MGLDDLVEIGESLFNYHIFGNNTCFLPNM